MRLTRSVTILAMILFCSAPDMAVAQNPFTKKKAKPGALLGEVLIFSIFVDTDKGYFEEEEKEYFMDELDYSLTWLEEQANEFGQDLEFNRDYFFTTVNRSVFVDRTKRRPSQELIDEVMDDLGYFGVEDFFKWNNFDFNNNKFKIVLFLKEEGRSHAYHFSNGKSIDLAIIYCSDPHVRKDGRAVITHEILHQFGAWDLYHEYGRSQTKASRKIILKKYYHSIMRNSYGDYEKTIDEVTAALIGWADYKPEFDQFDSRKNREQIRKEARDLDMKQNGIWLNLRKKKDGDAD